MASTTPKTMSSRLSTMKFMQRSAAKSTPASPAEPSTPDGRPISAKRVRLSSGASVPGTPNTPTSHGTAAALVGGEDARWEFSVQERSGLDAGLRVNYVGFGMIDADDGASQNGDGEGGEEKNAIMSFGGGVKDKKKKKVFVMPEDEEGRDGDSSSESEDEDEEDSEYDSDDPTAMLIREAKREAAAKVKEEKRRRRASQASTTRPKLIDEDADLVGLTSISGGRASMGGGGGRGGGRQGGLSGNSDMECYNCHKKGHMSKDCPNRRQSGGRQSFGGGGGQGARGGRGRGGGGGGGGSGGGLSSGFTRF